MPAETDTEKELKTTESLAVYESYAYVIKQKDGILVVYQSDGITEFFETNIRIRDLNEDMVKNWKMGSGFRTIRNCTPFGELFQLDYCSLSDIDELPAITMGFTD